MSHITTPLDILAKAGYEVNVDEAYNEDGTPILDRGYAYIIPPQARTITAKEIADCVMQNMEIKATEGEWPDEYGDFVAYYGKMDDEDKTPLYFVIGQYNLGGDVYINLYAG